ncbi:hypothetical protein QR680_015013 [Steinernema hermaphroditum]|uniref:Uncharacterized protein n=1 Tax=Steinernema hermaphroditum TaxID=289476 RepID=A0AA39IAU1_9BILA|nr:hypothetical protein QR680_015013 [Steinernema hermaphroditum]
MEKELDVLLLPATAAFNSFQLPHAPHSILMKFLIPLALCICFLFSFPSCRALLNIIGSTQSTAVKGKLICDDAPAKNITITLYDENVLKDTHMATVKTDSNGEFVLRGHAKEVTSIDPRLYIYYKCGKNNYLKNPLNYKRMLKIRIPDNYTTKGTHPRLTYDLGVVQLASRYNYLEYLKDADHYTCIYGNR